LGEYSFRNLVPGRTYVFQAGVAIYPIEPARTNRKPQRILTSLYYPGARRFDGALPVILRDGEERSNVDFRLSRVEAFCARAVVIGQALHKTVFLFDVSGGQQTQIGGGDVDGNKTIEVCNLVPGEYQFTVLSAATNGTPLAVGRVSFSISNKDVDNLMLVSQPSRHLRGSIAWDGLPANKTHDNVTIHVALAPVGRYLFQGEDVHATSSVPGEFTLAGALADDYHVIVYGLPQDAYVKRITCSGHDALHHTAHIGTGIGSDELMIGLGLDGGGVSLRVLGEDGRPEPHAQVIMFPSAVDSPAELSRFIHLDTADQNGYLQISGLAPGRYYVLARLDDFEDNPDNRARIWEARTKAYEVEIQPKSLATGVVRVPGH
jgi:hypothetical protein